MGGYGMMWGFIIKRIIGAASVTEKDRASSLVPMTQQTGFALGAAFSGLDSQWLWTRRVPCALEEMQVVAFWLFAGFVPSSSSRKYTSPGVLCPRRGEVN